MHWPHNRASLHKVALTHSSKSASLSLCLLPWRLQVIGAEKKRLAAAGVAGAPIPVYGFSGYGINFLHIVCLDEFPVSKRDAGERRCRGGEKSCKK